MRFATLVLHKTLRNGTLVLSTVTVFSRLEEAEKQEEEEAASLPAGEQTLDGGFERFDIGGCIGERCGGCSSEAIYMFKVYINLGNEL